MIRAEIQIHGYRKGHQLLASSIVLSKDDQATVDRLSDVAGPLRPKEQFAPYLSAYPLPSGTFYVLARTWQDLVVPRAGCVRTKSILINAVAWSRNPPILSLLRLLESNELPLETEAVQVELDCLHEGLLPPVPNFSASELLEALFLEDVKPVVVFDAPDPELISVRLLTALWPDIRLRFALSTFALSPRKIAGRDFDLVFAPANAKAKFSDWPGRRIDGRSTQLDRHRWTETIVRRVFEESVPRLLSDREIELLGDRDADNSAALRIALLWEDLLGKLNVLPTAALGLLDIANSGMVNTAAAIRSLEPRLVLATRAVVDVLPLTDAWDFLGAIARKIQGHDMPNEMHAIQQLATQLAELAPDGAVNLLRKPDPKGAITELVFSIATGLGNGASPCVEQTLVEAPIDIVARLVAQGGALTMRVAKDEALIEMMGVVLVSVDQDLADKASMALLPFLTEDRQLPAAIPIFKRLGSKEIAAELQWLGDVNNFRAQQLSTLLLDRAREIDAMQAAREVLVAAKASATRDSLLARTIDPCVDDFLWLLEETRLSEMTTSALFLSALRRSDDSQFAKLLSHPRIGERVVAVLPDEAADVLVRAVVQDNLPINLYVLVTQSVIPKVDDVRRFDIARIALAKCLGESFDGDEAEVLSILFKIIGSRLDGGFVVRVGLARSINPEIASRNLVLFDKLPSPIRRRIVGAVDEIARVLQGRNVVDLTEAANDACARLMLDAEKVSPKALIDAAGRLMPLLFRARNQPVSLLIAALFPIVYRELARSGDVPDLLKFFSFLDWDRCKTARLELITTFISSSWKPGDLALVACRCGDVVRILSQVARSYGGAEYLKRVENDLNRLGADDKRLVKRILVEIKSEYLQL